MDTETLSMSNSDESNDESNDESTVESKNSSKMLYVYIGIILIVIVVVIVYILMRKKTSNSVTFTSIPITVKPTKQSITTQSIPTQSIIINNILNGVTNFSDTNTMNDLQNILVPSLSAVLTNNMVDINKIIDMNNVVAYIEINKNPSTSSSNITLRSTLINMSRDEIEDNLGYHWVNIMNLFNMSITTSFNNIISINSPNIIIQLSTITGMSTTSATNLCNMASNLIKAVAFSVMGPTVNNPYKYNSTTSSNISNSTTSSNSYDSIMFSLLHDLSIGTNLINSIKTTLYPNGIINNNYIGSGRVLDDFLLKYIGLITGVGDSLWNTPVRNQIISVNMDNITTNSINNYVNNSTFTRNILTFISNSLTRILPLLTIENTIFNSRSDIKTFSGVLRDLLYTS